MSRKQNIRWLNGELPELVGQGVLPADAAERVRAHYGACEEQAGPRWAVVLFSIIGAVLVGGGVILLLAHNWDQFSRGIRTALSYAPMIVGQLIAAWVLFRRNAGAGAREGAGTFLTLAVGACVALVSQLYHLTDDFGAFMLTWMLLIVPLVYALDAVVPALIYLAGITAWAGERKIMDGHAAWFWILAAILIPFIRQVLQENRHGPRAAVLLWGGAICACISTGICLEKVVPGLWIIVYASLLSFFYFAGSYWFNEEAPPWNRPLFIVGSIGIAIYSLLLSNSWPWKEIGWYHYRYGLTYDQLAAIPDYVLAVGLTGAVLVLMVTSVRRKETKRLYFGIMPVVAVCGYALAALTDMELAAAALFSVYLFVISIATLVRGFRERRQGLVNCGMLMLSALIVNRFFDSEFDLLTRGIVFILLGIGFFAVNITLTRRKEAAP